MSGDQQHGDGSRRRVRLRNRADADPRDGSSAAGRPAADVPAADVPAADVPASASPAGMSEAASRPGRRNLALALAAGLLVIVAGLLVMPSGDGSVTTRTSTVLLPDADLDPTEQADYYELLSQGTITGSAAELLRQPRLLTSAAAATPGAVAGELQTSVVVVPDTAVLRLEVVGPSAQVTQRVSAAIIRTWRSEMRATFPAYSALVFGTDTNPSGRGLLLRYVLFAALVAVGTLTVGAVYLLLQRLAGRRSPGLESMWNAVRPPRGGAADPVLRPDAAGGRHAGRSRRGW